MSAASVILYDPGQPRVPKGSPAGGRFGSGAGLRDHEVTMLRDVAAHGAATDAERLYFSNSDGSQTEVASGEKLVRGEPGGHIEGGVQLTPGQHRRAAAFDKLTVVHNHPAMVTFSTPDIKDLGERANFERAHIVLGDGRTVHSIIRPPGLPWNRAAANALLARHAEAKYDQHGDLRWPGASREERHTNAMIEAIKASGLQFATSQLPPPQPGAFYDPGQPRHPKGSKLGGTFAPKGAAGPALVKPNIGDGTVYHDQHGHEYVVVAETAANYKVKMLTGPKAGTVWYPNKQKLEKWHGRGYHKPATPPPPPTAPPEIGVSGHPKLKIGQTYVNDQGHQYQVLKEGAANYSVQMLTGPKAGEKYYPTKGKIETWVAKGKHQEAPSLVPAGGMNIPATPVIVVGAKPATTVAPPVAAPAASLVGGKAVSSHGTVYEIAEHDVAAGTVTFKSPTGYGTIPPISVSDLGKVGYTFEPGAPKPAAPAAPSAPKAAKVKTKPPADVIDADMKPGATYTTSTGTHTIIHADLKTGQVGVLMSTGNVQYTDPALLKQVINNAGTGFTVAPPKTKGQGKATFPPGVLDADGKLTPGVAGIQLVDHANGVVYTTTGKTKTNPYTGELGLETSIIGPNAGDAGASYYLHADNLASHIAKGKVSYVGGGAPSKPADPGAGIPGLPPPLVFPSAAPKAAPPPAAPAPTPAPAPKAPTPVQPGKLAVGTAYATKDGTEFTIAGEVGPHYKLTLQSGPGQGLTVLARKADVDSAGLVHTGAAATPTPAAAPPPKPVQIASDKLEVGQKYGTGMGYVYQVTGSDNLPDGHYTTTWISGPPGTVAGATGQILKSELHGKLGSVHHPYTGGTPAPGGHSPGGIHVKALPGDDNFVTINPSSPPADWHATYNVQWKGALASSERAAVTLYTSEKAGCYRYTNKGLRTGKRPPPTDAYLASMDSALKTKAPPLGQDTIFYRHTTAKGWVPPDVQPGAVIQDKGWMSTSVSPSASTGFGPDSFVIRVKKGTQAGGYAKPISEYSSEQEFLFTRGARMRVLAVTKKPSGGNLYHVEYIGDEPDPPSMG